MQQCNAATGFEKTGKVEHSGSKRMVDGFAFKLLKVKHLFFAFIRRL
jgi:hypothetical protein